MLNRRRALGFLGAGASTLLSSRAVGADAPIRVAGEDVEVRIARVSLHTVRVGILPMRNGKAATVPVDGSLVRDAWEEPLLRLSDASENKVFSTGNVQVRVSFDPLTFSVQTRDGRPVQTLKVEAETGIVTFESGDAPVLGLGEGGPQFDRRGSVETMRNGQGGYRLRTNGSRVPIPWLIGTAGWAMFFHQPFGIFDLTGPQCKFQPPAPDAALPLDLFVVASREPAVIMGEYARLTGHSEMPPLWALGYQQSHRTLAGREEVLAEARMFREKRLPCDALIYLGTGFCPSGWNTANGSFSWNRRVFPDPKEMLAEFHREHFKIVLHAVILSRTLHGRVRDGCELARFDEERASCYWDAHREVFDEGVDGWWPDEGDPLDIASRLTRIRMYWEGAQVDRPDERPYALHRNGYAGMQRYAPFLWSGDVFSTWETLRAHIAVAINTGLTGIPFWGTDIGGFVPTKELTGELYVRWFQFGAFCPLFRAHGRTWKLRLPWGWNTGEIGPNEISGYGEAANPDPSELHNAQVEPICRKYLDLRYRLLPYLYSAVHECRATAMPIIRALWLHYPGDAIAVSKGDEYLWGRDLLVAPVAEKGARRRGVWLPHGAWYDFWTEERVEGGQEINRPIDLETIPLYARAGAILPLGPVKQYTSEKVDAPLEVSVFPGADGTFLLYEDDGHSFRYRNGEWMGLHMNWNDSSRILSFYLESGSRLLPPGPRTIRVRLAPEKEYRTVRFVGQPTQIQL